MCPIHVCWFELLYYSCSIMRSKQEQTNKLNIVADQISGRCKLTTFESIHSNTFGLNKYPQYSHDSTLKSQQQDHKVQTDRLHKLLK